MGSVTQFVKNLYPNTLEYNALQLNVQRRLSKGFQIGGAYTLAKGEGYTGLRSVHGRRSAAKTPSESRYWGPTAEDRRAPHVGQLQLQRADVRCTCRSSSTS